MIKGSLHFIKLTKNRILIEENCDITFKKPTIPNIFVASPRERDRAQVHVYLNHETIEQVYRVCLQHIPMQY